MDGFTVTTCVAADRVTFREGPEYTEIKQINSSSYDLMINESNHHPLSKIVDSLTSRKRVRNLNKTKNGRSKLYRTFYELVQFLV